MSRLDLNKATDFATLTLSNASELLQVFQRDQTRWAIDEASYRGGRRGAQTVIFHVFKSVTDYQGGLPTIRDSGGRRKAKYLFPYVDGQTTDDLGRKAESFNLEIILHGNGYRRALQRLMRELNDPIPGTLLHPVRGTIRCGMEDYELVHSHERNAAVLLQLRMTEHNFDFNDTFGATALKILSGFKAALQRAIKALQGVARAIAAVRAIVGVVRSAIEAVRQKIAEYYRFFQTLLTDTNTVFNPDGGDDTAAVLPTNQGGTVAPDDGADFGVDPSTADTAGVGGTSTTSGGFIRVSNRFTSVVSPTDPFANLPIGLLGDIARQAIEVEQLKRRVEMLRQMANEIMADCETIVAGSLSTGSLQQGQAAAAVLTLRQTRLDVLEASSAMQNALEQGIQQDRPVLIDYEVPRDMSIRELAFLNGLAPQDGDDIALLNRGIESLNLIRKGVVLLVPVFR